MNLPGSARIITTIIVANSPQLLLSMLVLMYNGIFTCMLLANEYLDYAYERKALRVTKPMGLQRSTYRLQLPYKYGIMLQVVSGVLHWLVSQTIFLARLTTFDRKSQMDSDRSFLYYWVLPTRTLLKSMFRCCSCYRGARSQLQAFQTGHATCRNMQCRDQCGLSSPG